MTTLIFKKNKKQFATQEHLRGSGTCIRCQRKRDEYTGGHSSGCECWPPTFLFLDTGAPLVHPEAVKLSTVDAEFVLDNGIYKLYRALRAIKPAKYAKKGEVLPGEIFIYQGTLTT